MFGAWHRDELAPGPARRNAGGRAIKEQVYCEERPTIERQTNAASEAIALGRWQTDCEDAETVTSISARERIAEIVREALANGQAVEIEGLGIFREKNDVCEFVPQTVAQVFVAYAAEDLPHARRVCDALRKHGCSPWLDNEKLLAGQNWPQALEHAIEVSDVFVACFSRRSVGKRGMFQQEIRHALECARRRPLDDPFVMPVRLEECVVPRRIAEHLQYVDLFPDWDKGVGKLVRAIRKAEKRRPVAGLV